MKQAIVTGAAGFIGAACCHRLIADGWHVIGVDAMTDYYDVSLKRARLAPLLASNRFEFIMGYVEEPGLLSRIFEQSEIEMAIHLAAQAGVRYSLVNPRAYLESNVIGSFELLEAVKSRPPKHVLLASTSSAYGANDQMPYRELDRSDHQMSFYAATKKSMEAMAHAYSHLHDIPISVFRFFTVYGPWGRPDMALFKFTKAILEGELIDVYNHGKMKRDFTYIDDLVDGLMALANAYPERQLSRSDSLSPVAPYRIVNIGNSQPVELTDFIDEIEQVLGKVAVRNFLDMQPGDVPATWADTQLLEAITGHKPKTPVSVGIAKFVEWYRDFYGA
ncbi:MAG: NAD-dependent epimerase/dehydratase family protein [Pseudomonadota bacterium]